MFIDIYCGTIELNECAYYNVMYPLIDIQIDCYLYDNNAGYYLSMIVANY